MRIAGVPWGRIGGAAISLALFAAALWVLWHEVSTIAAAHVGAALAAIGWQPFALAGLATAAGYLVLTLYDRIGLCVIGRPLPWRVAGVGAFLSFTIGHNLGLNWLTGGAMRHRVYSRHGLSVGDVAQVTLLNSITFLLGAGALLGLLLLVSPASLTVIAHLPDPLVQTTGAVMLLAVAAYLGASLAKLAEVRLGRFRLPLPGPKLAFAQLGLAMLDLGLAALALWFLIPPSVGLGFPELFATYLVALAGAVISSVPGGLGVFEALILLALPHAPRPDLVAGLIAYRIVYYLIPLGAAIAILLGRSVRTRGATRLAFVAKARRLGLSLLPSLAAAAVLVAGTVLLVSGATPGASDRMQALKALVPLFLVDLSHVAASLAGIGLILLAGGLQRRLDSAWMVACILLSVAAAGSLLKGFDWEEALLMLTLLGALLAARESFWRPGALSDALASPLWLGIAFAAFLLSIAAGFLAFAPVAYQNRLWAELGYHADASRFLRTSLVVGAALLALLVWRVARPARVPWVVDAITPGIERLVAEARESMANLALTGDKRLLVAGDGSGFIMYQVHGRTWVALGDPVGPEATADELVIGFIDMADRHGGSPAFYQVGAPSLARYVDCGLVAYKLGEEARVDLAAFDIASPGAKALRYALRRGARERLAMEVVPPPHDPARLSELARVSEAWLSDKSGAEMSFSLGRFDPAYLARQEIAVVRHDSRIVAFANLWRSGGKEELSIDLMRHVPDAPPVTMRFLFGELLLFGQRKGFRWFNLGMAPMSGMARHRLAPAWHRLAGFLFDHGERFYGFTGLRDFKESFHPIWSPRYFCCRPGAVALARGLADVARLIGRRPPEPAPDAPVGMTPRTLESAA